MSGSVFTLVGAVLAAVFLSLAGAANMREGAEHRLGKAEIGTALDGYVNGTTERIMRRFDHDRDGSIGGDELNR